MARDCQEYAISDAHTYSESLVGKSPIDIFAIIPTVSP
jgi:hypothetical protein